MPFDAERVRQLRHMLLEARRRKLSEALRRRRASQARFGR
jgi:hypothetical protein